MADEKPQGFIRKFAGWIITSVVGLASGAFLMYLTPLVNSVIKPAKPVANFAAQVSGLTANFNNRSTGAVQGWWDFGDGTALEPFDPKIENVKHAYPRPGTYTVKLTLTNLIGDEDDRSSPVTTIADSPTDVAGPAIDQFELTPLGGRERAPAVYKLASKVKNANFCILSCGDRRPTEIIDAANAQDRYVSFEEPGAFVIRLAAVNGKQIAEQIKTVNVRPSDPGEMMAKLLVSYQAVQVERAASTWAVWCDWQGDAKANVSAFRKERPAHGDNLIVSADLAADNNSAVRNLKSEISADKKKVIVTGELVKATGLLAPKQGRPGYLARLQVVEEHRSAPQTRQRATVAMAVPMNGTVKVPVQPLGDGWEMMSKQMVLQLWDGSKKAWETNKAASTKMMLNNQSCVVTATPQPDGFSVTVQSQGGVPGAITLPTHVDPTPVGPVIRRTGFERSPLFPKKSN